MRVIAGRVPLRTIALALTLLAACGPVATLETPRPSATALDTSSPTRTNESSSPTPTPPLVSLVPTPTSASTPTVVPTSAAPSATTGPAPKPTIVVSGDFASSTIARAGADTAAATKAADAVRALAVDLYRQLTEPGKNLVFSPYSAAAALAMTRVGARGETARQMDTVLHAQLAGDLDAAFNALDLELAKRAAADPYGRTPPEIATANRLFAQRGYAFATPFLDRISAYYGAGVGLVDYVNARDAARLAINAWVSDRTKARIPDLIKPDVLNDLTRFVLVNAIYLKARWSAQFTERLTTSWVFHKLDGSAVESQLMRNFDLGGDLYGKGPGYQVVGRPLVGGLSMVMIVPDLGSFAAVERDLDATHLASVLGTLAPEAVELGLPKFTIRTSAPLVEPLKALGMPIAFDGALADFSGITTTEPLHLQDAVQQAFIAVDEEGVEASAATAIIGGATGGPSEWVTLTIDRPFIYLIRDDATGAILFMGRVLDPSA